MARRVGDRVREGKGNAGEELEDAHMSADPSTQTDKGLRADTNWQRALRSSAAYLGAGERWEKAEVG